MIEFNEIKEIYAYCKDIDMRIGMNKIKSLLSMTFKPGEMINNLFIFVSRNRRCIKVYYEDLRGSWLLTNKIQYYKFQVEGLKEGEKISREDLECLLSGVEMKSKRENKIAI